MVEPIDLDALERYLHIAEGVTVGDAKALIAELRATREKHREAEQGWYDCTLRAERAEAERDEWKSIRNATRIGELLVRCDKAEAAIARVRAELEEGALTDRPQQAESQEPDWITRAKRAEAAIAACGCNTEAGWEADAKFKAMEAAIARLRRWAINGTYDAQQAASFRVALDDTDTS